MISCKHDDIHTACGLRNIPIRYAGLLRHCVSRNDTSKNRHRGNGNTQVCILPRASLGLLLYSAQVIFTLKTRWAKTQTAIPCDDLFGDVPHGTIVATAVPFEQLKGWR